MFNDFQSLKVVSTCWSGSCEPGQKTNKISVAFVGYDRFGVPGTVDNTLQSDETGVEDDD